MSGRDGSARHDEARGAGRFVTDVTARLRIPAGAGRFGEGRRHETGEIATLSQSLPSMRTSTGED